MKLVMGPGCARAGSASQSLVYGYVGAEIVETRRSGGASVLQNSGRMVVGVGNIDGEGGYVVADWLLEVRVSVGECC